MAGWSNTQTNAHDNGSTAGTTGFSLAFSSNVSAGQLIVAISEYYNTNSVAAPTFTDTSGNVTSFTVTNAFVTGSGFQVNHGYAWGIATASAACTIKVTWPSPTSIDLNLSIGAFNTPGGTITQDGTITQNVGSSATVTLPAANGTGANDLILSAVGFAGGYSSLGGAWATSGGVFAPNFGDGIAYLLNAAGTSTPDVSQTGGTGYGSSIIALQASGAPPPIPLPSPVVSQGVTRSLTY